MRGPLRGRHPWSRGCLSAGLPMGENLRLTGSWISQPLSQIRCKWRKSQSNAFTGTFTPSKYSPYNPFWNLPLLLPVTVLPHLHPQHGRAHSLSHLAMTGGEEEETEEMGLHLAKCSLVTSDDVQGPAECRRIATIEKETGA